MPLNLHMPWDLKSNLKQNEAALSKSYSYSPLDRCDCLIGLQLDWFKLIIFENAIPHNATQYKLKFVVNI